MGAAATLRSRIEFGLRRVPIPALRDIVAKRPASGRNIDALDGVRGLAVLLVIASHTGAFHLRGQGGVGVWLFFCLSAFLLTMPFADRPERATDLPTLRRYFARRVRRIVPAYYLILAVDFVVLGDVELSVLARHVLFLQGDSILWTIPQEVLFYALLPFFAAAHVFVFRRSRPATVLGLAAVAVVASFLLDASVFAMHGNGHWMRFYLGVFATGMAFAYAHASPRLARIAAGPRLNRALGGLGLAILVLLLTTSKYYQLAWFSSVPILRSLAVPMGWAYPGSFAVLCSALIYITLVCEGRWIQRLMSSLVLRALGITSYSLYLWHLVVLDTLMGLGVAPGLPLFAATLGVAYPLSCAIYAFVERPFMQKRS
ncbi:MAG: acyltransferase [Myxococcales bacterium]|nr:acyltransferase [Myxococcales bacterium]